MDFEKYIKFGTEYLSEYFWVLLMTLKNPVLRFAPVSETPVLRDNVLVLPNTTTDIKSVTRLNPKLIGFALISIFIGLNLQIGLVGILPFEIPTILIFFLLSWIIFGSGLHLFCKLLKGKGSYIETISVTFQVQSTLYVVGILAAFIWKIISSVFNVFVLDYVLSAAFIFYFSVLLSTIYYPLALTHVHNFGRGKKILLGIIIYIGVVIWSAIGIYIAPIGHLYMMPI